MLEPIFSFTDHPALKWDSKSTIYSCADRTGDIKFYLANNEELVEIIPTSLHYTNMGEPYRVLARLYFIKFNSGYTDQIDISMEDAAILYKYFEKDNKLLISDELMNHEIFARYLETEED